LTISYTENGTTVTKDITIKVSNKKETISSAKVKENSFKLDIKAMALWKGSKFVVKWGTLSDADGYDIFATRCGKKMTSKSLVKTVKGQKTSTTLAKIEGKKISGKMSYKVKIKAYKIVNGKKVYIATSHTYHVAGNDSKTHTNVKKVKLSKKSVTIKKGKTSQIKATIVKQSTKKKLLNKSHGPSLRYYSTDTSVATVTAKGKIKSKGKGTCYIYIKALNGVRTKVKVTVK
ncbi:MAG: Ig-like domain-containing protein, partial [Lachnospira sp.]